MKPDKRDGASQKPARLKSEWRIVDIFDYTDKRGKLLYQVVRKERGKGNEREKDFPLRRPDGKGGWIWDLEGVERVPYRLQELLAARVVIVVEGEKCVEAVRQLDLPTNFAVTTNSGGAGKFGSELARYFMGKKVVLFPDSDEPGRKHALTIASILLDVAASIRIVELPGLADKGDIADWIDAGGTFRQLKRFMRDAKPLDATSLEELRKQWELREWPDPKPLQSELPPVKKFPSKLLPASFRSLVSDISERMQVPLDLPAAAVVVCIAGVVNRRASIQPKANDSSWLVVPNLWGGIIAPPGFMKSPVIQAVTRPLDQVQEKWLEEDEKAKHDHEEKLEEWELRKSAWRSQVKACAKAGKGPPKRPPEPPEQPKSRRLIVNESTFEKLHETMSENPAGVLVIRDELTGWWSQLDRAGREGERAFHLSAWNGDTGHIIDRIGRGSIHVPACCESMIGGIQPGRLRSYLVEAIEDGPGNDGLIQRFQLLVWPDTVTAWEDVDRLPDASAGKRLTRIFQKLVELDPQDPLRFRFSKKAQMLFNRWHASLEAKVRGDELHPALISHLSKFRSLMPSLALLFELADRASSVGFDGSSLAVSQNFVSSQHAQRAIEWCTYLESHALRVYSCVVNPQLRAARELSQKIKKKKVGADGFFSCRDIYLKGWSGLDTPEVVKHAAEILQDAFWVREVRGESRPSGGRPSSRYAINPKVWK